MQAKEKNTTLPLCPKGQRQFRSVGQDGPFLNLTLQCTCCIQSARAGGLVCRRHANRQSSESLSRLATGATQEEDELLIGSFPFEALPCGW